MANIVVIGIEGENGLYVVDLEAGTVEALDVQAGSALGKANDSRGEAPVIRGVNLAVRVASAPLAASGHFEG